MKLEEKKQKRQRTILKWSDCYVISYLVWNELDVRQRHDRRQ